MARTSFDGTQGRIVVSGYKGVKGSRDRSISFWLKTTQDYSTVCWWGSDPAVGFVDGEQNRIRLIQGKVGIFGRGSSRLSATAVNDDVLHHVVFTWSRDDASYGHEDFQVANVYVDGVLDNGEIRPGSGKKIINSQRMEASPQEVDTSTGSDVVIGALPDAVGGYREFFLGEIDEFAIHDYVLGATAVTAMYNSGTPGVDLLTSAGVHALQLWYRMGDDPGDTAPTGTMINQAFYNRDGTTSSGTTIV